MLTALRQAAARLRAFFKPGELDRDFQEELSSHVAMLTDDNIRRGMTPEHARRAALIRVGAPASLEDQHRDARGLPALESVLQDVRFAFRLLAKDRLYSAAAIVTLALGIGTNAAGFTIVNAAFLRGLPYDDADRLHVISWHNKSGRRSNVSFTELEDCRTASRSFKGIAAYRNGSMNVSGDRAMPEQVNGTWLTANAFGVIGQRTLIGRDFTSDDERPGADPVVIIGHELWERRYGSEPSVLGQLLRVNGQPATIVGVMPEGMRFPENTDAWVPLTPPEAALENARTLRVFGRLSDDSTRRDAQTELNGIAQRIIATHPELTKDLVSLRVETFTERYIGGAGRAMFLTVMGAVVFVLLIACANVANLLLSRSTVRAREIAVRMAIGATRWRVVRQLLIESFVLSVIGGGIGLLIAGATIRALGAGRDLGGLPFWVVFNLDYVVFAYVAAICIVATMLFGLAPALHVSKTNTNHVLKEGGKGSAGSPRIRRFGAAMVVIELTLTTTLLVGAGLMIRSFMTLYSADLAIRIDNLMTMRLQLPESKYKTPDARRAFFDRLEPRLAAIPGIEAAAVTNGVPPHDGGERLLLVDALNQAADSRLVFVGTVTITPRFFDAIGVSLVRGRAFHDRDGAPGSETVIINERLAAQFFPGEDALGRRLRFTRRDAAPGEVTDVWRTIVGICPTIKHGSPQDGYINAVVYIPYRQETPATASLLVRTVLPPESVMEAVRREVQSLDPDQPVLSIQTLSQVLAENRWWWRTWSRMFGVFAVIALVLSAIGLYAVIAYSVEQRTHEIGVRMALGAQRLSVYRMILGRALTQLAIGLTIGIAGAYLLSDVLWGSGMIVVSAGDPLTYGAITILLTVISIAACMIPAVVLRASTPSSRFARSERRRRTSELQASSGSRPSLTCRRRRSR